MKKGRNFSKEHNPTYRARRGDTLKSQLTRIVAAEGKTTQVGAAVHHPTVPVPETIRDPRASDLSAYALVDSLW